MPVSNSLRHRQVIEIEAVQIATRELSDQSASSFGHASVNGHFADVRERGAFHRKGDTEEFLLLPPFESPEPSYPTTDLYSEMRIYAPSDHQSIVSRLFFTK